MNRGFDNVWFNQNVVHPLDRRPGDQRERTRYCHRRELEARAITWNDNNGL